MSANIRWNIFARVLEDILMKRQLSWQNLYERAAIEQDIVDRLQTSLSSPTTFPVLTIEEMDEVIDVFDVSPHEVLELRAAIIAISVEQMLMERIESQTALLAAEQVFSTALAALVKQKDEKHGDGSSMSDRGLERFFDEVERYIDAGKHAKQLSRFVTSKVRVRQLQEGYYHFEQARRLLERERSSPIGSMRLWQKHYLRVQKECEQIRKELKSLGE